MTFADFLYQAGFWQWFGLICFSACLASFRIVTIKHKHYEKEDKP